MSAIATLSHLSEKSPQTYRTQHHRILVCLDNSPAAQACLAYAVSLAKTFGSLLTLVHVMQPQHSGTDSHDVLTWEILRQQARALLARYSTQAAQVLRYAVEVRLEQGQPAERITDLATEIGADITVVGSHASTTSAPSILGSTTQQVLNVAHNSVLIAHCTTVTPMTNVPKRILVPLDGSLRTESVLPAAAKIANTHGAAMVLVHVVKEPMPTKMMQLPEGMNLANALAQHLEEAAEKYLDALEQRLVRQGVTVQTMVVRHTNERRCLLELVRSEKIDLIVLSAHGAAADSTQAFGSVPTYMLSHATVPVLVLQDLPSADIHHLDSPMLRGSYASEQV